MRAVRATAILGATLAMAAGLSACGSAGSSSRTVTVYAAASLGPAFERIAADFEDAHPGIDVRPLVLDGSQVLATQIREGAPADVFASADEATMERVSDRVRDPVVFATNTLTIAVPPGNPAGVARLSDLADPRLTVVLCAVEVPCGAASRAVLDAAGVAVDPASEEQNVGAVLAKVAAGEADAGLVYRTDIERGGVEAVEAEGADAVVNRYPIGAVEGAADPDAAADFVDFVAGAAGQEILADFGFGAP